MRAPPAWEVDLAPVREALLAGARATAGRIRTGAAQDAQTVWQAAVESAEAIRHQARAAGAAAAASALAAARARAGRRRRTELLAADRAEYDALRVAARAAAQALGDEPGVQRALIDRARARLDRDAQIAEVADGGVIAVVDGRRLDYSLRELADRAVDLVYGRLAAS